MITDAAQAEPPCVSSHHLSEFVAPESHRYPLSAPAQYMAYMPPLSNPFLLAKKDNKKDK